MSVVELKEVEFNKSEPVRLHFTKDGEPVGVYIPVEILLKVVEAEITKGAHKIISNVVM